MEIAKLVFKCDGHWQTLNGETFSVQYRPTITEQEPTMKIYTYAAILHPTDSEKEDGVPSQLIVKPTSDLFKDSNAARTKAALDIPKEHQDKINRIEILVKEF